MKVLFLIPHLDYHGPARQLVHLATGLPRPPFERRVCTLVKDGPLAALLRQGGIPVESLGWHRSLDLRPLLRLRRLVREFAPEVVHVWGPLAVRALRASATCGFRVVSSAPFVARERRDLMGALDRCLLRRVEAVTVQGAAESDRCAALGMPAESVIHVPPGVGVDGEQSRPADWTGPEVLKTARFIGCMGPLEVHKGFRDALWSFDMLRYLYPDLHLMIVGDGPESPRLEQFLRRIALSGWAHLLGRRADGEALLARAAVVWVPSHAPGGVNVALEAMAAGRPVVASRLPGLADVVVDGQTGFLYPPGDKVALARQTRLLLDNPDLCARMGQAGRERAGKHFAAGEMVRRFMEVYETIGRDRGNN